MDNKKWTEMRRQSVEKQSKTGREDSVNVRILSSLKPFAPAGKRLFSSTTSSGLPAYQRKYNDAAYAIRQFIDGKSVDIGMEELLGWFPIQYRLILRHDCIDFNRFYALKTFQNLSDRLQISNQELAYTIHKWIFSYSDLGYDEQQKHLSISTLKTPWIVENLIKDISYRKKSYY